MLALEADPQDRLAWIAAHVRTVNPDTGLSTDFLNQYNELSMLLDLAADDPDLLEELRDWEPRSYDAHFAASGFRDSALVVEAYHLSPAPVRAEFDAAIGVLNSVAASGIRALLGDSAPDTGAIRALAAELQAAIVHASGLINGGGTLGSQAQVDTLFARARADLGAPRAAGTAAPAVAGDAGAAALPGHPGTLRGDGLPLAPDSPADGADAADGTLLDQDAIDVLFD